MKRKTAKQNPWEKKTEGNDTKLKRATTSKTKRKSNDITPKQFRCMALFNIYACVFMRWGYEDPFEARAAERQLLKAKQKAREIRNQVSILISAKALRDLRAFSKDLQEA